MLRVDLFPFCLVTQFFLDLSLISKVDIAPLYSILAIFFVLGVAGILQPVSGF